MNRLPAKVQHSVDERQAVIPYAVVGVVRFHAALLLDAAELVLRVRGVPGQRLAVRRVVRAEARRWVEQGDCGEITFVKACAALDLNPESVRRRVLAAAAKRGRR